MSAELHGAAISNKPEGLPTPEYFDTIQAAAYIGMSVQYLEIARHKGFGPSYIKLSHAVRYKRADLDSYMEKYRRATTEEAA